MISKVLVANRGEIAVRILRAARDAGISSVAVYADSDINAPFAAMADEAYALNGDTAADTYLNMTKIIEIAQQAGADAIHPGYGFLSENADFAQAVIDSGLTWIGPSPHSIAVLGDKVAARSIAQKVHAPMAPGTTDPVSSTEEALAFAEEYGLPVAIKAAYGGGGRGMKVAWTLEEIPELLESATREAETAFGRGECFIERYLDHARHVECQVLADQHGNVVVAGDRDCSVQRRYQKLVEEAPAPFLTQEQRTQLHDAAKAICREAGYYGAGTVEFLLGRDGLISFLEVNTRLQVEHPVTEMTSGIDLVREQFRIADGATLRHREDPTPRGHAFEFRINGEDPALGFLPQPGTITTYREPSGVGVRVDSGVTEGTVIGGNFDSMLAKLIVYGEDREEALQRARRVLSDFTVEGVPTVLPFHREIVNDPAFTTDFSVSTTWIENEWDNTLTPYETPGDSSGVDVTENKQRVTVEVNGRRVDIALPAHLGHSRPAAPRRRHSSGTASASAPSGASQNDVTSPMQATVVTVAVSEGDTVSAGDVVAVLEAMKMENPVKAPHDGTVTTIAISPGDTVTRGAVLMTVE